MALADVTGLSAAPAGLWRALALRLQAIGFHHAYLQRLAARLPGLPTHLVNSGLAWLTLDATDASALALRLFLLGQALTDHELEVLLGATEAHHAAAAGLLLKTPAGWAFPFRLELVNQLLIVSDPPADDADTVMAVGGSTQLLARASYPQADIHSALDLGCGSGTLALLLAGACRRVVATDINPRALQLARLNAALNGIGNIDWRQGDLFEPVAGERFDLVVAQPPFLPRPAGAPHVTFLHGGARGDELALAVLAQVRDHLHDGGMAVMLSDFPVLPMPLVDRLRAAAPAGGVLLLQADPPVAAATQATLYGGPAGAAASLALYRHLEQLGIQDIAQAVVVLHTGHGQAERRVAGADWSALHRSDIDRLLAECSTLEHAGRDDGLHQG